MQVCSAPLDAPGAGPKRNTRISWVQKQVSLVAEFCAIDFVGWGIVTWMLIPQRWSSRLPSIRDPTWSPILEGHLEKNLEKKGNVNSPSQKVHKLAELPGCELLRPKMPGCDRCGSKCPVFRGGRFLIEVQAGSGTRRDPVKRYKPGTFYWNWSWPKKYHTKMQVNGSLVVTPVNGCFGYHLWWITPLIQGFLDVRNGFTPLTLEPTKIVCSELLVFQEHLLDYHLK